MTEYTVFAALAIGAQLVALVVAAHGVRGLVEWTLRNWPADGPKVGE